MWYIQRTCSVYSQTTGIVSLSNARLKRCCSNLRKIKNEFNSPILQIAHLHYARLSKCTSQRSSSNLRTILPSIGPNGHIAKRHFRDSSRISSPNPWSNHRNRKILFVQKSSFASLTMSNRKTSPPDLLSTPVF
jgi:hypothetical protein